MKLMYRPTNVQLIEQPNGSYIASFDVEIYFTENIREVANFPIDEKRVILFEVMGPGEEGTERTNEHVDSAPYNRETEEGVLIMIAKGGKIKGSYYKMYA